MKLIECKLCKKDVSDDAKICPHCGVKNPGIKKEDERKAQFWGMVVLIIIIAYFIIKNIINSEQTNIENTSSTIKSDILPTNPAAQATSITAPVTEKTPEIIAPTESKNNTETNLTKETLGISFAEASKNLDKANLSFESEPLLSGEPRMVANPSNQTKGVIIEFIGNINNLTEISLLMLPMEEATQNIMSVVCANVLVANIFPNWSDSTKWINKSIEKASKSKTTVKSIQKITKDNKTIILRREELGWLTIVIKNKDNKDNKDN